MVLFDEHILRLLKDGKLGDFQQILGKVGFSHNTLRLHLKRLVDQGLIVEKKTYSKGRGRPRFTYFMPPKLHRQPSRLLSDPFDEIVTLSFRKLRHLCRFEKDGYCKKIKKKCEAQNCPQILKGE